MFGRLFNKRFKQNNQEVKLFRDDWLAIVRNERRSKPIEQKSSAPLGFTLEKEPIQSFLKQFEDQGILPRGITYHFRDYYFLTPGFPTIVVDADNLSSENGDEYKSILKAYLLCILGAIAPQEMLTTRTLGILQSATSVRIGNSLIAVPMWVIKGLEELGHLHFTGDYEPNSNQMLLTLAPILQTTGMNYELLGIKLEKIALMLKGEDLHI